MTTKNMFPYQSQLLIIIDTLLFGETHKISTSIDSINVYLNEGYEIVMFSTGEVELKYIREDDSTYILYDGYDFIECLNKYKAIISLPSNINQ